MKVPVPFYFLLVVLIAPGIASGQKGNDSLGTGYFDGFLQLEGEYAPPPAKSDTVFRDVYFFDKISRLGDDFPRSGGPGAAALDVFNGFHEVRRIRSGFNQFDFLLLHPVRQLPNDSTVRRYSNVEYHIGSRKEQHLVLSHHQRIKPWIKAGLDFGAFGGEGEYTHQNFSNKNFDLWLAIGTRDRAYRAYVGYTSNNVLNEENGGITSDSIFENASSLNTRTLPIYLSTAEARLRTRDYLVKQELNLTRLFFPESDSIDSGDRRKGNLFLSNSTWWSRKSWLFTSASSDTNYFEHVYLDSSLTYDSSFFNDLFNQAMAEYIYQAYAGNPVFSLAAGVNYQCIDYFTSGSDTNLRYTEGIVRAGVSTGKFSFQVSGTGTIDGDVGGLYNFDAEATYQLKPGGSRVRLTATTLKNPQSLRDGFYQSNHFIWSNDFDPFTCSGVSAAFDSDRLRLTLMARAYQLQNKVYYGSEQIPLVYTGEVGYGSLDLVKSLLLGKWGSDIRLSASWTDNNDVVTIPPYAAYASVYFKSRFFKKAMGFKGGVDFSTSGPYYLYGYMPATGVFYLQEEKETGNYPVFSMFVSMRIKTAGLFLRLDHMNAGLNDRSYYGALHQPMPGRTLKFGVTWDLID